MPSSIYELIRWDTSKYKMVDYIARIKITYVNKMHTGIKFHGPSPSERGWG